MADAVRDAADQARSAPRSLHSALHEVSTFNHPSDGWHNIRASPSIKEDTPVAVSDSSACLP
jgi:hypothetical protein